MKNKKTLAKLAPEIVVTVENPGTEDECLNVSKSADEAAEHGVKKLGGVYVLKELITIEGTAKVTPAGS